MKKIIRLVAAAVAVSLIVLAGSALGLSAAALTLLAIIVGIAALGVVDPPGAPLRD